MEGMAQLYATMSSSNEQCQYSMVLHRRTYGSGHIWPPWSSVTVYLIP
jgi:hypothetical protein